MLFAPTLPAPEWDEYADAWFHRSVIRFLQEDQPDGPPHPLRAELRDDPEFISLAADTLLARRAEFVRWIDDKSFVPDCFNGRWVIDWQAVERELWGLVRELEQTLYGRREAAAHPSLDDWLGALARGELSEGLREPHMTELLPGLTLKACDQARARRLRQWPRVCRSCGTEFLGGKVNAVRCPQCTAPSRRSVNRRRR